LELKMKDRLYNKYSMGVLVGGGRVKGGSEGEGTWLLGFINKYEIKQ
jgi:hypothetical protein